MSDLNPQQHAAMTYIDGPVLVLAGAGSGKTRVITRKIAYLIEECGYEPRSVAAVTFTNKAAREMKERVAQLVSGKNARGLIVSTFHNLGLRILRVEHAAVGLKSTFSIFDARDAAALVQELMHREVTPDKDLVQRVQWQISAWKNALVEPASALAEAQDTFATMAAVVYEEYDRHLRAYNAVDFDDLIGLPTRLLRDDADTRERWQKRIRYLLVDEYQDTNGSQYELIKHLVGRRAALTVVGDDDQSIYAWRGAQPENLHLLQTDYPQLKVIKLEQNYRSTARILRVANQLISNNPHLFDKRLWSDLGLGDELRVVECRDELHEAEQVAADITHQRFSRRANYHDFAILYRGNHQSRLVEQALRSQNIPYVITGGQSFFDHIEVKDLIAYLRLLANPADDAAFIRCVNTPRRGIGAASLEKLGSYANQRNIGLLQASDELGVEELLGGRALAAIRGFTQWLDNLRGMDATPLKVVHQLIDDSGYEAWIEETSTDAKQAERRWNNVGDLLNWIQQLQEGDEPKDRLEDIVAHMSLMDILDRQDSNDERPDRVHLMTLHAAKGLEFPHVYLIGMEENLLPHRASIEASDTDANAIEEERRLAYVGITRAQRTLTFTHARRRKRAGELIVCEPSRFLAELPENDLRWEGGKREVDPEERQERGKAHLANLRELLK